MFFQRLNNSRLQRSLLCAWNILLLTFAAQGQFRFDSWTTDDGLPQNSVYSVVQTRDGYIWFTTLDGLVRFDGIKFKVFNKSNSPNLATNRLKYIFADADDTLWISTENGGLIRYRNNEFRTFTADDGLPSNDVIEVQKDLDGSLLIVTTGGIVRTSDGGASFTLERRQSSYGYRIYIAPSGTRWEISNAGLTATTREGQTVRYDLPAALKFDLTYNFSALVRLFKDQHGTLWLSASGNLYRLQAGEWTAFPRQNGMPQSSVQAIAEDAQGNIWLGTEKDGACRLAENRINCFTVQNGLSSNNVLNIFLDREKTLWIATTENGINRVSRQIVMPLSVAQGLADKNVYPILEDHAGNFWIGAFSALSRYTDGKITNYKREDGSGLLYEAVQALFKDRDGRLWVGSVGGVQVLENDEFTDFTQKLNLPIGEFDFYDIHQTGDGALWFATEGGVFKYENNTPTHFTTGDGLPHNDVKAILETGDGALWFGTLGGAARFENGKFTTFTEADGLAGNYVRSIYEDETGVLWFGTYDSGLSRYKDGKFTKITHRNGLFSNGVFQILPDARGNFWMSSNQGIYRVRRAELDDFADGKIGSIVSTAFNKSDGMLSTECNGGRQPAGIRASDGRLWFPTQNGVAIVDPEAVQFNPLAPPVVIEAVLIDNVPSALPASAGGSTVAENPPADAGSADLVIEPGQNDLEIQYTGLSFIKPEQIRFRYKLEGLDENWTEAGGRRTAYFPYLPPGSYTFRVIAANSDNVWNETGATLAITVKPPFYRTWWFVGASVLVIALAAFGAYRARVSRLERARRAQEEFSRRLINAHETERRRIAAELHDSIGQSLAMIKNRAVFGAQSVTDEAAKEQLELITSQTAQTIGEVREISYNLRPYLLDRLGLTKAIKSLLNKIGETHRLKIGSEIDDVDRLFESEAEMSVYRIVQESLNNVVKHAEATEAKIAVRRNERDLTISIEDDGKGFDLNAPREGDASRGGFGLLGLTERVRMLGGSQKIESAIGKGTRITVKIPFREMVHRSEPPG